MNNLRKKIDSTPKITWISLGCKPILILMLLGSFIPISARAEAKSVTIAFQGPLTGPEAYVGIEQLEAFKYAIKKFNAHFAGRYEVKTIEVDDQGSPEMSQKIAPAVAADREIIGLVGPSYSGATIAALTHYKKYLLPMISPSASRTQITKPINGTDSPGSPIFHRVALPIEDQGPLLYRIATHELSMPKLFVIDNQTPYSAELFESIRKFIKDQYFVGFDSFPERTTDFSATLAKIKASGANSIIYLGWENQHALIKQLRDSGYSGQIVLSETEKSSLMANLSAKLLEGIRMPISSIPLSDFSLILETDYRNQMKSISGTYAAETIDSTNVLLTCISQDNFDRESMLRCIKLFKGKSVYGKIFNFEQSGDSLNYPQRAIEFREGKWSPLFPLEVNQNFLLSDFPWMAKSIPTPTPTLKEASVENNGLEIPEAYAKFLSVTKVTNKYRFVIVSNLPNESVEIFARKVGGQSYKFVVATDALGSARFETIRKLGGYRLTIKFDGLMLDTMLLK